MVVRGKRLQGHAGKVGIRVVPSQGPAAFGGFFRKQVIHEPLLGGLYLYAADLRDGIGRVAV